MKNKSRTALRPTAHLPCRLASLSVDVRCAPPLYKQARCRFPSSPNDYLVERQFNKP